jgi:class 3 adenylate cyclase
LEEALGGRSALVGEHKLVTIFFLDIVDSVEHSTALGAERWHFALDALFRLLAEGVHRFGGTVNQYTGDGIMALFGAPVSHEDHCQRACFAALHLRDRVGEYSEEMARRLGERVSVRMALHAAEVVVGAIGDDLRMDYTAQGAAVGIAARLQELAEPGAILTSARTAALAEGFVLTRSRGPVGLKGIDAPVEVHELLGRGSVEDRFVQSRERGLSRFCGRRQERQDLEGAFEETRGGRPAVVGVRGPAGIGKSRLLHEFARWAGDQGADVFELRGVTHRELVPFEPVGPLLRGLLGVDPQAEGDELEQSLDAHPIREELTWERVRPFLCEALGIPRGDGAAPVDSDAKERVLLSVVRAARSSSPTSPRHSRRATPGCSSW